VRLLQSTSPEIAGCFESGHYLLVRRRGAKFHGLAGNLGILLFLWAGRAAGLPHAISYTGLFLIVWNLVLLWRSGLGRHNWVFLVCQERFYVRMFSPRSKAAARSSGPDVIVLDAAEVLSIGVQTRTIFVHGPKPKIVEGLVMEPEPAAGALVTAQFNQLSPPIGTCDPYREWFAGSKEGTLRIPWQFYRPALRPFLDQIELHFPKLTKSEVALPDLDLISAVNAREPERRRLLAEAKRMGYGAYCIHALWMNPIGASLYMRRSLKECVEYMTSVEAE
jgi:hypothetical protein